MAELDLSNIQGDVVAGLAKKSEVFFFFKIQNAEAFKAQLQILIPHITTSDKAIGEREEINRFKVQQFQNEGDGNLLNNGTSILPIIGINISFSHIGLVQLIGEEEAQKINDEAFKNGQKKDAKNLNDRGTHNGEEFTPEWDTAFLQDIHGVVLITGDSFESVDKKLAEVKSIFSPGGVSSVTEVTILAGDVRPGNQKGHEHFGYKDGISNPRIEGVSEELPGQTTIQPGIILLGRPGDDKAGQVGTPEDRPNWALDGSFLAFRKLPQLVPEFEKFLVENAKSIEDDFPDAPNPADILGARLIGRWKSGAPLNATPLADDPVLADDRLRNNKFKFNKNSQEVCPFAAHIRKMNPRKDVEQKRFINPHLIMRRGIPFGPELTTQEKVTNTTQHDRGLYFVSYQSNLANGFSFLQRLWANNPDFPPNTTVRPGLDPLIGQEDLVNSTSKRDMSGHDDDDVTKRLVFDRRWVESKGGEYFFSPSISTLNGLFTAHSPK